MRIDVDGQHYDVPDDATHEEIDAITRPAGGPGMGESLARGAAQGATLGFGDEIQGAIQAAGQKVLPEALGGGGATKKGFLDLYREARDSARKDDSEAQSANPKTFVGGNLAGGLATLPLAPGGGMAVKGGTMGARLLAAAKAGGELGAASGFGASGADLTQGDVVGAAKDAVVGGGAGAAAAVGLPLVGKAVGKVAGGLGRAMLNGLVEVGPEAKMLQAQGVRMTLGQASPRSWINSLEQSAESIPVVGDHMKLLRGVARQDVQNVALSKGVAPGQTMPTTGDVNEKLSAIYDGFEKAYAPVKSHLVQATVPAPGGGMPLAQAFGDAVKDPNVLATSETRSAVAQFLDNQLSAIHDPAQAANAKMMAQIQSQGIPAAQAQAMANQLVPFTPRSLTAGDLLGLRSNIRSEIRGALQGANPDFKTAKLLRNAEEAIGTSLKSQLPPDAVAHLAATDAQYAKMMTVSDAVRRSGDLPGGFTPAMLSQAVKSSTPRAAYAQGAGGELRDLARAGRATIDQTVPPTGARLLQMLPGGRATTAALAALANTQSGARILTGATTPQLAGQALVAALRQRAGPMASQAARNAAQLAAITAGEHTGGQQ